MPEVSFLLTPQAMSYALAKAGLEEVSWIDKTDACRAWADEMQAKRTASPGPLGLHVVMGPEFAEMAANLWRNLREGRVRLIQVVMAKARAA